VNPALLLDTHIALWLDSGDDRLRPSTRLLIDDCWRQGGTIWLSAVSVWEIALFVDLRRIELDLPIERWVERFVRRPGVEAAVLGMRAAAQSYRPLPPPPERLVELYAVKIPMRFYRRTVGNAPEPRAERSHSLLF
jgi:PIN domain nuclease of toxin-antitoxin system